MAQADFPTAQAVDLVSLVVQTVAQIDLALAQACFVLAVVVHQILDQIHFYSVGFGYLAVQNHFSVDYLLILRLILILVLALILVLILLLL